MLQSVATGRCTGVRMEEQQISSAVISSAPCPTTCLLFSKVVGFRLFLFLPWYMLPSMFALALFVCDMTVDQSTLACSSCTASCDTVVVLK